MKVEASDRPWLTTLPQILVSFSRKRALVRRKKTDRARLVARFQ